ncbi:MAG: acyl carrier protein [Clostridia bacterium]
MIDVIREIVYNVTGKENLEMDTDFLKDLGLNSFDIMNIVCAFEERYDITVPTRDVWQLRQVSDVVKYLADKGITE